MGKFNDYLNKSVLNEVTQPTGEIKNLYAWRSGIFKSASNLEKQIDNLVDILQSGIDEKNVDSLIRGIKQTEVYVENVTGYIKAIESELKKLKDIENKYSK